MPGIVDAHRHMIGLTNIHVDADLIVTGAVEGVWVALNTLRSGITTVRDPGCKHMGVFTLKRLINEGFIPGPQFMLQSKSHRHCRPRRLAQCVGGR